MEDLCRLPNIEQRDGLVVVIDELLDELHGTAMFFKSDLKARKILTRPLSGLMKDITLSHFQVS